MKQCYLQTPGGILELWSNDEFSFGKRERLLLEAYVPGTKILETPTGPVMGRVHHPGDDSVWFALYGVLRRMLITRGVYPVHAACVGNEEKFTLIVGYSGAGKSTIAETLISNHGMSLFSGNKTVTRAADDKLCAIAGTKTMTRSSRENRLGQSGAIRYWDRVAYRLPEGLYASNDTVPIDAIVMVGLNDYDQVFERLSEESALHRLYPFFLDAVGADVILADDFLDGEVPKKAKERLARELRTVLQTVPVYRAIGSLSWITKNIDKRVV